MAGLFHCSFAKGRFLRYSSRMNPDPQTSPAPKPRVFLPIALALLGIFGMAAVWTLVALILNNQCGWMAVLAAADIAFLLRLGRAARGRSRAIAALVATFMTILIANWAIAAAEIGLPMQLHMMDAIGRLGIHHAHTLLDLANRPVEWIWYAIAAIVALWLGR